MTQGVGSASSGTVYLVGAGPGDPELLTLRGACLLSRAEIVVHDALLHPAVLALAPANAQRLDVGKRCGRASPPQHEINRILIEAAARARTVIRLKGGDPFLFGRGGEEALALAQAGVRFEVVPGVTAGLGAAAYAGIPLTDRHLASEVTFVTGHELGEGAAQRVDWEQHARGTGTLVIYMGLGNLPALVARLVRGGRHPETPAAAVQWATRREQRTVSAPLGDLPREVALAGLGAPAVVLVGDVVALRGSLDWFGPRAARRSGRG